MTGEKDASAEMPGVEEIARLVDDYAFKSWQQAHDYEMKTTGDAEEAVKFADWSAGKRVSEAREKARAILDLFAPIMAEKEREIEKLHATVRKAHVAMTMACALPGVASEYDFSEAVASTESTLARRAAAIRAQGE